jgi:hypothetical protein
MEKDRRKIKSWKQLGRGVFAGILVVLFLPILILAWFFYSIGDSIAPKWILDEQNEQKSKRYQK